MPDQSTFADRHIGLDSRAVAAMLAVIGVDSLEQLAAKAVPTGILDPLSSDGYLMVRDAIAMGLTTLPFALVIVLGAVFQNWRKKLRGGDAGARPGGGYR